MTELNKFAAAKEILMIKLDRYIKIMERKRETEFSLRIEKKKILLINNIKNMKRVQKNKVI